MTDSCEIDFGNWNPAMLSSLIEKSFNNTMNCDKNETVIHSKCLIKSDDNQVSAQCPNALIYLLIKALAIKPDLLEDKAKDKVVKYYKDKKITARGLVYLEYLKILNTAQSKTLTWLKYETLLSHLIRERIYDPSTMANEVLSVVKCELPRDIAIKFCSVIDSCVKHCREATKGKFEEEEEKWCEIIEWISWFLASSEDDFS